MITLTVKTLEIPIAFLVLYMVHRHFNGQTKPFRFDYNDYGPIVLPASDKTATHCTKILVACLFRRQASERVRGRRSIYSQPSYKMKRRRIFFWFTIDVISNRNQERTDHFRSMFVPNVCRGSSLFLPSCQIQFLVNDFFPASFPAFS